MSETVCMVCSKQFGSSKALKNHKSNPGKKHDKIQAMNSNEKKYTCQLCSRSDFKTEQALTSHKTNPGMQHIGRRNPCKCPISNLNITRISRTNDGFIHTIILECKKCHKFPICVPLPADRILAQALNNLIDVDFILVLV